MFLDELRKLKGPIADTPKATWYLHEQLDNLLKYNQNANMPTLDDIRCMVAYIKKEECSEILLINNKKEIVKLYPYTFEGEQQMYAFINILKINKHFENKEKNIQ